MLTSTFISINENEEFFEKSYKHKFVYMMTLTFNILRHLLDDTLKDVLSEQFRNRCARLCQVNIKVNLIVWLVEFFGCMTLAIDFLLVGSRSSVATATLGTLTILFYFNLLPFTFLINCSTGINTIVDKNWIDAIQSHFKTNKNIGEPRSQERGLEVEKQTSVDISLSIFVISKPKSGTKNRSTRGVQGSTNKIKSSSEWRSPKLGWY